MTVRPIIFSGPMIMALLAGRKTQTRRLITSPLNHCEPGDLLYARENFAIVPATAHRMSDDIAQTVCPTDRDFAAIYAAGWNRSIPKWRPSIHMPRWASRVALDVTDRRAQRLQSITDEDAIAEGVQKSMGGMWCGGPHNAHGAPRQWNTPRQAYFDLWDTLHGEGAANDNPEVCALTFTVHKANIDDLIEQRKAA